jgi:ATP-dependent DNA helicase DinG
VNTEPHALLDDTFGPHGPIARALGGYEGRSGQVQMAKIIERGFLENMHTVVEAGTGVGKSLAYLVPALRTGKRVIISTGTIALQEQLVRKDIPLVVDALGVPARIVLLKGRRHYLCRSKYEEMSGQRLVAPTRAMERIWAWADKTTTGDRSELDFSVNPEDWEALDADADDCTGEICARFSDCYFFRQRDAARYADIVVVNHALFFLDLAMGGGLLPEYDYVVLDEAHQCERFATGALTAILSPASVARVMRRLHRHYRLPSSHDAEIDEAMRWLQSTLAQVPGDRYPVAANTALGPVIESIREALGRLQNFVIANWQSALKKPSVNENEVERRRDLSLRAVEAQLFATDRIAQAIAESGAGIPSDEREAIGWVERLEGEGRWASYSIKVAPFEIASFLRAQLFARTRSVVLTSATIAEGSSFAFIKDTLGVDEAQELIAPSPFDYPKQARLYIADPKLNPKTADFGELAAPIIEECLDRSSGRAFVLFTSYMRLREIYGILKDRMEYPVKVQGDLPRTALLAWFRATPNAVLFATATFWEGIDVVGDQLSCVIIDRLPFPSPNEPLIAARMAAIEARGRSSFAEYMIPSAIVRLKQGFGRLIRSKTDRGLLVLLDGRATGMRYGATIVDALPPATRITNLDALDELFGD